MSGPDPASNYVTSVHSNYWLNYSRDSLFIDTLAGGLQEGVRRHSALVLSIKAFTLSLRFAMSVFSDKL